MMPAAFGGGERPETPFNRTSIANPLPLRVGSYRVPLDHARFFVGFIGKAMTRLTLTW